MDYGKPAVTPAWGESNTSPADMVAPSTAEVQAGWPSSPIPPSRQRFNWILHFLAQGMRYLMQMGVPEWDAAESYRFGSRVSGDDGNTWVSLQNANVNHLPSAGAGWWAPWGLTLTQVNASQLTQATLAAGDDSTKLPNTSWVRTFVNGLVATINTALAGKQPVLGFTPVQQGTGVGQTATTVKIGSDGTGGLKADTGADLGHFVFKEALAKSLVGNGYAWTASGLLIQWGVVHSSGNTAQVGTFVIPFPNAGLAIVISGIGSRSGQRASISSASQFSYSSTDNDNFQWIAVGY